MVEMLFPERSLLRKKKNIRHFVFIPNQALPNLQIIYWAHVESIDKTNAISEDNFHL